MFPTYAMRLQNCSSAEENIILLYKVQVLLLCGNFTIYTPTMADGRKSTHNNNNI